MEENFVFESSMRDRNEMSNGFLLVGQVKPLFRCLSVITRLSHAISSVVLKGSQTMAHILSFEKVKNQQGCNKEKVDRA